MEQPESQTNNQTEQEAQQRGRRTFGIFPVANSEIKKVLSCGFMALCLSCVYSSSRELKDSYFLDAMPSSSIPYVKLAFVLPVNIITNLLVSFLLEKYTVKTIFLSSSIFFSIYFVAMGLFFIPLRDTLQVSKITSLDFASDGKIEFRGFAIGIIVPFYFLFCNWVVSLNYCVTECFSSTGFAFLMFAFFNYACQRAQFGRFLPLILIFMNLGTIISGIALHTLGNKSKTLKFLDKHKLFSGYFIACGVLCGLAAFLVFSIKTSTEEATKANVKKKKSSPSITESIRVLLQAKVILAFSLLVIFFNFLINVIEMDYKSNLRTFWKVYKDQAGPYGETAAQFTSMTLYICGAIVILVMLSPLKYSVKMFGWTVVGFASPIFLGITAVYICVMTVINFTKCSKETEESITSYVGTLFGIQMGQDISDITDQMKLSLQISSLLICGIKAIKYAFFDVAKEALTMKIEKEDQAKYKSIYDGICGKLGKSTAAVYIIICTALFEAKQSNEYAPVSLLLTALVIGCWCFLVVYIGRKYAEAEKDPNATLDLGKTVSN